MYPDLYKGLNLKTEDLEMYDSPLMGFDGRMVIPCGMIRLSRGLGGAGQLYHGKSLLPLHSYLGQTLASCYRCDVFNFASESQVSHSRESGGANW